MNRKLLRMLVVPIAIMLSLGLVATACGDSDNGGTANGDDSGQAANGSGSGGGDAAAGKDLYAGTCASCHGADAKGLEGLGKDLTTSEFAIGLSDDELVDFIKQGRPASDPDNTTGVDMPAKGGNPALTDDDLHSIVAYLRELES